jgi:hypothetical protein
MPPAMLLNPETNININLRHVERALRQEGLDRSFRSTLTSSNSRNVSQERI